MITLLLHLLRLLPFLFGGHRQLALENLALRQQLAVYHRTIIRPPLRSTDRLFWIGLAKIWTAWRGALVIVTPETGMWSPSIPSRQIVDAFPDDCAPSYILRDRDSIYGPAFRQLVKGMGIDELLTAPHSPWQNPFAERLIGSIRRECLEHVLVLRESHLRRILARYFSYYHRARTHLSLDKDAPDVRPVELPEAGGIVEIPEVGGLHHRYVRQAA